MTPIEHVWDGLGRWFRYNHHINMIGPDSLVDKASALGAGGRRFDSQSRSATLGIVLIWPVGEPPAS